MADIFSKYTNWPTYAGYGEWTLLPQENQVPGSKDHRIPEDQLPATQYAVKYNPMSNEIELTNWIPPTIPLPSLILTGAGLLDGVIITASYNDWLANGEKNSAKLLVGAEFNQFGAFPPTFDYSISDQFKECVHYGFVGTLLAYITALGKVYYVTMNSFYGYMEYISRCRMKSSRLVNADIASVSVNIKATPNWTYKLATTLRNDVSSQIDLSLDNVVATIYTVDKDGKFSATVQALVKKIEGQNVYVDFPTPSDPLKEIPEGWTNGYIVFNKIVIVRNPLTLYCDRKYSQDDSNIPDNNYVKSTNLGYETRQQQIQNSGSVSGIYVSKEQISGYLNTKILDPATTPTDLDNYKKTLEYVEGSEVESIPETDLIYGSFEANGWGKTFLYYMKELGVSQIILYVGIGGGTTMRHNMHAGCLAGEYFVHTESNISQTYRVTSHIRRNVYELNINSKTSNSNLIDVLLATADVTAFNFSVEASRMWYINDLTFGSGSSPSPETAAFWGHISAVSTTSGVSSATLTIDSGFRGYSTAKELYDRFVQPVPASNNFLQKWDDSKREWYFNGQNSGSYKISQIVLSSTANSFDILFESELPSTIIADPNSKYWISFDKKFEITGGYSYITTPFIALDALLGGNTEDSRYYNNVIIYGVYVGLPLKEKLSEGVVLSVVFENGGAYSTPGKIVEVYISTARKGSSLSMALNQFNNMKNIAYVRNNDPMTSLVVRRGTINYIHNVGEHLVYYGEPKKVNCPVSGVAGGNQTISLTSESIDHVITGIMCYPTTPSSSSVVPVEIKHGNYIIGYPSVSGIVSTLYTRTPPNNTQTEEADFVTDYKSGSFLSTNGMEYLFASNVDSENVGNKSIMTLSPKKNQPNFPKIGSTIVYFVPRDNVVKNVTDPYVYPLDSRLDCVLYVKNQVWVKGSPTSFKIDGFDQVKAGRIVDPRVFNPVAQIDESQDGIFMLSTSDYSSYLSGNFAKPSPVEATKKISDFTPAMTPSDLYRFPFLLVPNITRCSYSHDKGDLFVAGYSYLRSSASSTDFGILSLVFHRINFLDLSAYPVYAVRGGNNYAFTYCNYDPKYKRIINIGNAYNEFPQDAPLFVDPNLAIGTLAIASNEKVIIIIAQQSSGFVFFLSDDHGNGWAYIDDIFLVKMPEISSPSIKIYNDSLWLMFMSGDSLYLKKISMMTLSSLIKYSKNKKSSQVQDTAYQNLKINVQSVLDAATVQLVSEINEQQVAFETDREKSLHIIGYDAKGIRGINSQNSGGTWDYNPVNF